MTHRPALDRQHSTRQRLLGGFVLLSMALHAPLLLHHSATERSTLSPLTVVLNPPLPEAKMGSDSKLEMVEMGSDSKSPPPTARRQVAPTPAATSVTPVSAPATTASALEEPAADSPPRTPAAVQEIESDPISETEPSAASVAARINLALAQHFRYPVLAVRRGWQGTVLLGLRVTCDGHIEAIHVAQSSGHALLDRAALDALQQVRKIALEGGPLRVALDLQLPVIYHLEES